MPLLHQACEAARIFPHCFGKIVKLGIFGQNLPTGYQPVGQFVPLVDRKLLTGFL